MRNIFMVILLGLSSNFLLGQFIYESSDFIEIGDEIIYSNAVNLDPAVDYALAGEGVSWDFSNLITLNKDTVTYFDPNDSGYQLFYCFANFFIFNCDAKYAELTNLAELSVDSFVLGDFRTANITRHYHLSEGEFAETMLGVTAEIEGIDVPVAIDLEERDRVLKFPLVFGNEDSSESRFVLDLNAVNVDAGFARSRNRVNIVEGYGSLRTPANLYDEVLKVKTLIYNTDTTIVSGVSIPIESVEVEYKWYAKGIAGHVLKANGTIIAGTELIAQVQYSGTETIVSTKEEAISGLEVYPNPFNTMLHVRSDQVDFTSFEILNQLGQRVANGVPIAGRIVIGQQLSLGTYFLVLRSEEGENWVRKVVKF